MKEAQTLKLEAGKIYVTHKNGNARVVGRAQLSGNWIIELLSERSKFGNLYEVGNDGKNVAGNEYWDIVAEYIEPKRIKAYVNIYANDGVLGEFYTVNSYASKDVADDCAKVVSARRVAYVEIDVLEGHGLGEAA